MKKLFTTAMAFIAIFSIVGCEQNNIVQVGENPFEPIVLTSEQKAVVQANNQFALNYLAEVEKLSESCNFIVSPLSAGYLLGMMLNGAEGKLAEEIKSALGFENQETDAVNEFYGQLIRLLPEMDKATTVSSARGLFPSPSLQFYDDFKVVANNTYLAETERIDYFKSQSAVERLNTWCSNNTGGMIQDMFSANEIDPTTVLVLIDADYFNGAWSEYFDKKETGKETFTKEDGSVVQIPFMKKKAHYSIFSSGAWSAVSIPYGNGAFSMTIILPGQGVTINSVIQSLQQKNGVQVPDRPLEVELWLPRFDIATEIDLLKTLCDVGIPSLGNPVFTRLAYDLNTNLQMKQKASINVDEQGTVASAASAAIFSYIGVEPTTPMVFHADRPFIFLINENSTGVILYAGCFRGESK